MAKGTRSTKNASGASKNQKVSKAAKTKELAAEEVEVIQEKEINEKNVSENDITNFNERPVWMNLKLLWAFGFILLLILTFASTFLYFENRDLRKSLIEISANQEKISDFLGEESFAKTVREQFNEMYLNMVTTDLERRTQELDEKIKTFRDELIATPTKEELMSDLDPILKDTLLKMEENLSLEISKRIESLNNLTKELSNEISANGEININLILQELDKVNEDIERIKEGSKTMSNELKAVSSNINRINSDFRKKEEVEFNLSQQENMQTVYSEVQEILRIIPNLTTLAIRNEYVSETIEKTDNRYWGQIKAFFGSKITSRSLKPKEGSSVDAIMSRAENALKEMDLNKALVELESLPDTARATFIEVIERVMKLVGTPESTSDQDN
tara:strand:- start:314 stop:1480 length:1167 start_codon:yes stop_codon:yes gene_type:complete